MTQRQTCTLAGRNDIVFESTGQCTVQVRKSPKSCSRASKWEITIQGGYYVLGPSRTNRSSLRWTSAWLETPRLIHQMRGLEIIAICSVQVFWTGQREWGSWRGSTRELVCGLALASGEDGGDLRALLRLAPFSPPSRRVQLDPSPKRFDTDERSRWSRDDKISHSRQHVHAIAYHVILM